jgi:hypothetical protein
MLSLSNAILFVEQLPAATTAAMLTKLFSQFPGFKEVRYTQQMPCSPSPTRFSSWSSCWRPPRQPCSPSSSRSSPGLRRCDIPQRVRNSPRGSGLLCLAMSADSPFLYTTEVSVAYRRGVSPLIAVGGAPRPRHPQSSKKVANRNVRDFGWEIAHEAVFATPADFPRQDRSPYSHAHARRGSLGFVHRSRGNFCRPVPNVSVTILNFVHRCVRMGFRAKRRGCGPQSHPHTHRLQQRAFYRRQTRVPKRTYRSYSQTLTLCAASQVRMVEAKPGLAFVEFESDTQSSVAMAGLQGFKVTPTNAMAITFANK